MPDILGKIKKRRLQWIGECMKKRRNADTNDPKECAKGKETLGTLKRKMGRSRNK